MGLFDKLKNTAASAVGGAVNNAAMSIGNKSETFTFTALPESLAQMQALPEASLDSPFKAAALTVCALCAYAADKNIGTEMLNWLRGPRPLNGTDNDYTPSEPFRVTVQSTHVSGEEQGYMKLFIPCGGADSPRPIKLRMKGDGKWFLWEQYLLTGIRTPKSADPWA